MNRKRSPGFTVLELLVVVVVLGILASLMLVRFANASEKAYRATMQSDLRNFTTAQALYFAEHASYADAATALNGFAFSEHVSIEALTVTGPEAYQVALQHARTNTRCELAASPSEPFRPTCTGDTDATDPSGEDGTPLDMIEETPEEVPDPPLVISHSATASASQSPTMDEARKWVAREMPALYRPGAVVSFSAYVESGGEHLVEHVVYDFGDGTVVAAGVGEVIEHTYEVAGEYSLRIQSVDSRGARSTPYQRAVSVRENTAPVGVEVDVWHDWGRSFYVEVLDWQDDDDWFVPEWRIVELDYSFTDPMTTVWSGGAMRNIEFAASGTYTIQLIARDPWGLAAPVWQTTINVP